MKRGIELIAEERQRQIDVEGYSEQHDSQHKASELIYAAIAYVESAKVGVNCAEMGNTNEHEIMMRKVEMGIHYPFGWDFKPSTDVCDLVKAGALIAAAIDRMLPESEDEKVRKGIVELVKQSSEILNKKNQERMLAWLEKQGQVKESTISQHENKMCKENDDSLTSEGEKMMKEIIELVMRPTWKTEKEFHRRHELCAWLKKQVEHANFLSKIQVGDKVTRNEDSVLVNLSQLKRVAKPSEKQGEQKASSTTIVETGDGGINALVTRELPTDGCDDEQKSADKVKPKFKVGDWVIFNEHHNRVYQVEKIQGLRYYLRHYLGGTLSLHFDNELIRLWTLQDAKSGDVLADDTIVLIVDHLGTFENRPIIYSWYFANSNKFYGPGPSESDRWEVEGFHPATKEQRDTLIKAMADAGYTFDFEKKKLKNIVQKPEENKGNVGEFPLILSGVKGMSK